LVVRRPADVAEHLKVGENRCWRRCRSSAYRPVSLFAPLGGDDDAGTLADVLATTTGTSTG